MLRKSLSTLLVVLVIGMFAKGQSRGSESQQDESRQSNAPQSVGISIPPLVRFSGRLANLQQRATQGPISSTFALYKEETGGVPLWIETQNVTLDPQGRFTVLLGAASSGGLLPGAFSSSGAQWLGMTVDGAPEGARVMFLSVPYAFESADAERIGGRSPDEFVTKEQIASYLVQFSGRPLLPSSEPGGVVDPATVIPNLNADLLHGFADSAFAKLNSTNQFALPQEFPGGTIHPPSQETGVAESSSPEDFKALGTSSGTLVSQLFRWQANGSTQGGKPAQFSLSYGAGGQAPQPTGLSINADGTINFAPGQTFPIEAVIAQLSSLLKPATPSDTVSSAINSQRVVGSTEVVAQMSSLLDSGTTSNTIPSAKISQGVTGTVKGTAEKGGSGTSGSNQGAILKAGGARSENQTASSAASFGHVYTVSARDNWSFNNIPTALTSGTEATVTLPYCPEGVDTSGNAAMGGPLGGYPVAIIDGIQPNTNSESVYVTGGDCTPGSAFGTIVFTPFFSHAASTYTIESASGGIQEAINKTCGTNSISWRNGGCEVIIPPVTVPAGISIYDTIYFHADESLLSGYGATLNCLGRGPCLQVGDLSNANDYSGDTIAGLSFRSPINRQSDPAYFGSLITSTQRTGGTITIQTAAPHNLRTGDRVTQMLTDNSAYWGDVPYVTVADATHYTYTRENTADIPAQATPGTVAVTYLAVFDNANTTELTDIKYNVSGELGGFNHFFDFWDDENALIQQFDNEGISLNGNANWTGSFIWSGGASNLPDKRQQLAPVITVSNSSITANTSNCATVYNSNEFSFLNSVCQAQGPWEFLISNITGNYQGANFQNIYSESAIYLNPASPKYSPWPGLGVAGFIGGSTSGTYSLGGQGGFSGAMPSIGSGSTSYVYYAVGTDVKTGLHTSPLPFLYEYETSPGQVSVQWPRLSAGADTVVYDLIRNPAPQGTMNAAGGGYVAPYTGNCNGGSASACGSIATGLAQCAGFVCSFVDNTAVATSPYNVPSGTFAPNPTFWPGDAVLTSTQLSSTYEVPVIGIAFEGTPSEVATYCSDRGGNVSGGYTQCMYTQTTSNNSVPDQPALILTDGNSAGGGGVPGAKGRLIFETTPKSEAAYHQVITIYDSNPLKTQATTGHRPVGDPGDIYVGLDPNGSLMIGGGVQGIHEYVNNIGDGHSWLEELTNTLKTFAVPVQVPVINVTGGFEINGSKGASGQCIMTTGNDIYWGTPTSNTPDHGPVGIPRFGEKDSSQ